MKDTDEREIYEKNEKLDVIENDPPRLTKLPQILNRRLRQEPETRVEESAFGAPGGELRDEDVSCQSGYGPKGLPRDFSSERHGSGVDRRTHSQTTDPGQAAGYGQGGQSKCRSKRLLALLLKSQ